MQLNIGVTALRPHLQLGPLEPPFRSLNQLGPPIAPYNAGPAHWLLLLEHEIRSYSPPGIRPCYSYPFKSLGLVIG